MTKIQQMLDAGIPVIESQSDEANGSYTFSSMTQEQQELLNNILSGFPISISTSSNVMIGDGVDEVILTVKGEPNTMLILDTLVGSTTGTISISLDNKGNGSQLFSCSTTPTKITIFKGDVKCEVRSL